MSFVSGTCTRLCFCIIVLAAKNGCDRTIDSYFGGYGCRERTIDVTREANCATTSWNSVYYSPKYRKTQTSEKPKLDTQILGAAFNILLTMLDSDWNNDVTTT